MVEDTSDENAKSNFITQILSNRTALMSKSQLKWNLIFSYSKMTTENNVYHSLFVKYAPIESPKMMYCRVLHDTKVEIWKLSNEP